MKALSLLLGVGLSSAALAGPMQSSFTPTGYRYPIMQISIAKADFTRQTVMYKCAGATAAECLVDVTDPASIQALQDAALNVELEPGEYSVVVLNSCPAGTTGTDVMQVQVEGSVTVGGESFHTSGTVPSGMTTAGSPEFTNIDLGCGGAVVTLQHPIVVAAGSEQTLTLLVDLTNVTWTDPNTSNGMGGCKSHDGAGQGICTTMPFIVPFVGDGSPTFERYLVSHREGASIPLLADANASVNFGVDPAGEVFYVGVAPFLSETSPGSGDPDKGGPDYNTSTRTFSTNPDSSIALQTGGSAEDNRVGFTAFRRETHLGTCKNELSASATWNYQAFKQ